jgi:cobalt/nickel transport system permease protein
MSSTLLADATVASITAAQKFRPTRNFWYRLSPTGRVVVVLVLLIAVVSIPNGGWWSWGFYGLVIAALIGLSRTSLVKLGQRLAVESGFVATLLLGTLFRSGGEVLWQWGWLQLTSTGLLVLGSVSCKTLLSLLLLNLLTLTTPATDLLDALLNLRVPPLLVAILAAMYRYISVLQTEFQTMRYAAQSRNLTHHPGWQRLVVGNMIGSLLIRTLDRSERIHRAMLSRGYQGIPSRPASAAFGRLELLTLVGMGMLALAGHLVGYHLRG